MRKTLLEAVESAGWPEVATDMLSSGTLGAMTSKLSPGREAWEAFASYGTLAQLRHVRMQLEYKPAIFKVPTG